MVIAAAPGLGAFASTFKGGIEDRLGERAHRLPYGAVFFRVDEVAHAVFHLAFALLYEKGLAHAHQRRSSLGSDGRDMASDESVIGGGGNDGSHIVWCLRVELHILNSIQRYDKYLIYAICRAKKDDFF